MEQQCKSAEEFAAAAAECSLRLLLACNLVDEESQRITTAIHGLLSSPRDPLFTASVLREAEERRISLALRRSVAIAQARKTLESLSTNHPVRNREISHLLAFIDLLDPSKQLA